MMRPILIGVISLVTIIISLSAILNQKDHIIQYAQSQNHQEQTDITAKLGHGLQDLTTIYSSEAGVLQVPPGLKILNIDWRNVTVALDSNSTRQELNYMGMIERVEIECQNRVRLGGFSDGAWDMCIVEPYKPKLNDCLVYSFGINNVWYFEDAVTEQYGCLLRAFDPTINKSEHVRGNSIHFYPLGLHKEDFQDTIGEVKSFPSLIKMFGDQDKIMDFLKIDIEHTEWDAFSTMFQDNYLSTHVKQLAFEAHSIFPNKRNEYISALNALRYQGFHMWHEHANPFCAYKPGHLTRSYSNCNELYFINVNFLKKIGT